MPLKVLRWIALMVWLTTGVASGQEARVAPGSGDGWNRAAAASGPTFSKDVAPIFFAACVACHRPGQIAPMSLLAFEEARPWAKAIRRKVVAREMPPWFADPRYGRFRNNPTLSDRQIETIVAWVDAGAPKGADADLPPPPAFTTGWSSGEPDFVIEMPVEFEVPAEGEIPIQNFYQAVPFEEDRFAEVLEIRPSEPAVLHHGGPYIVDLPAGAQIIDGKPAGPDGKRLTPAEIRRDTRSDLTDGAAKLISYVPGRGLERHRAGTAKRIPAGKFIVWNQHYQPHGRPVKERSRLGLWFSKVPVTHEVLTQVVGLPFPTEVETATTRFIADGRPLSNEAGRVLAGFGSGGNTAVTVPTIPPYADDWKVVGVTPFPEAATLYALSPHMHLRGKNLTWLLTFPDGTQQTILSVPDYDFNWQIHYELETPLRIPAGSVMTAVGHFDNSVKNKYNPAPEKEVFWAEQSWDEMFDPYIEITVDRLDLTQPPTATER
jgi:hypothetical protein